VSSCPDNDVPVLAEDGLLAAKVIMRLMYNHIVISDECLKAGMEPPTFAPVEDAFKSFTEKYGEAQ
jgi:hypothetical protein